MAKKDHNLNPYVLAGSAIFLLVCGWLMKSFPFLLLVAYAPLFGLTDRLSDKKPFWNQFEFILIALSLAYFSAFLFSTEKIAVSIVLGIAFTLPWIAFGFAHQALGNRTTKILIIFFWISVEYMLLKTPWRADIPYLADGFILQAKWMSFSNHTGWLGVSVWVLSCNLLAYLAIIKGKGLNWTFFVFFVLAVTFPFAYQLLKDETPLTRELMIQLYHHQPIDNSVYQNRGEWLGRTAAWVSALVILLSLVKNKIGKK